MISMLILAFGVLAMGGLQLASLRSSQSSSSFSMAATLAKDYTEMMRSNISVSNNTSTVAGVNPYLFDTGNTSTFVATPVTDCKLAICTGAQISVLHVADWAGRVAGNSLAGVPAQLPGGRAVVCRDATPRNSDGTYKWACDNVGNTVVIKLGWIDKRDKEERGGTSTVSATPLNPQLVMVGFTGYAE